MKIYDAFNVPEDLNANGEAEGGITEARTDLQRLSEFDVVCILLYIYIFLCFIFDHFMFYVIFHASCHYFIFHSLYFVNFCLFL